MRTACIECVRKHVGAAVAAIDESLLGHPSSSILVEGNLDQAASEVMKEDLELALELRAFRRQYSQTFQQFVVGKMTVEEMQKQMPDSTKLLDRIQERSVLTWSQPTPTQAP